MTNVHTTIPFGDIWIEHIDGNVRAAKDADLDVSDLVASIPIVGLLEPLGVYPAIDGRYPLVYGWRRHKALRELKFKDTDEVPVVILETGDEPEDEAKALADTRLLQLTENLMRVDLDPVEISNGFYQLLKGGWKQKDIAATFNTSTTRVSQLLALQRLPPEITALIATYQASVEDGAQIARLKDPERILAEWERMKASYDVANEHTVNALAHQVEYLLRRDRQQAETEKLRKAMFTLGYALCEQVGKGWRFLGTAEATDEDMKATFAAAMEKHRLHPSASDRLQWYAGFAQAERGEVDLYLVPSEEEAAARAADPALEKAHEEREAADRERRAVDREVHKAFATHVQVVIDKPPVARVKGAALAYSTHVHAPQSKKQAVELLGLEVKMTKDGKKDWDGTYYGYCDESRKAGDDKALARIFLVMQFLNGGLRDFFAAEGVPTEADIRKQVLKDRKAAAG